MKGFLCTIGSIVVLWLVIMLFGFYSLDVGHSAVILTMGTPSVVTEPGLHWHVPIFSKVTKVDTTIKGLSIGYDVDTGININSESIMISSDYNFLNCDFYLEYRVTDPIKALYSSDNGVAMLKASAQNCIRTVIASYPVDSILTTGKSEIQTNVRLMLAEKLNFLDIGLTIVNVTIQDAEPPTEEVSIAFKEVETARQQRETSINEANKYRNENLPAAEAEVDGILQQAEATKTQRIQEAVGQVSRFNAMFEEYQKFPLITKRRMFYEAMEDILPNLKVYFLNGDGTEVQTMLPLDTFATSTNTTQGGSSNE